jgi:hypothetical protein
MQQSQQQHSQQQQRPARHKQQQTQAPQGERLLCMQDVLTAVSAIHQSGSYYAEDVV